MIFQVSLFLLHILSVPAIVEHLNNLLPEVLANLLLQKQSHDLAKSVRLLAQDQQLNSHFNALEGSYALCLADNLVHLVSRRDSISIGVSKQGDIGSIES